MSVGVLRARVGGWRNLLLSIMLLAPVAHAEWDFEAGAEDRYFTQDAAYGQDDNAASLSGRAKYHHDWNDGNDLMQFEAFYRWSDQDENRTHGDIQDLAWLHVGDGWELRSGIRTVFWGVTEFQHLVDIVNQTDLVERTDGEAKLGQPMINLSLVRDWGILDVFALAGFRDRTFPSADGRPRSPIPVDTHTAQFESSRGRDRVDFAMRWTRSIDAWDLALSYFSGTSRDPEFHTLSARGELVPFYPLIEQVGLELQHTEDAWLWKLEALSRGGMDGGRYAASVFGFEYTIEGVFDTEADLGLVSEYNWDERGDDSPSYLEHDIALGTRWAFNDVDDTSILAGLIYDPQTYEKVLSLEAHRRLGDVWKLNVESYLFSSHRPPELADLALETDKLAPIAHDDYIQVELVRYF